MFNDRSRQRKAWLQALPFNGRIVRVQDMMMDDIVWESTFSRNDSLLLKNPVYFSSPPYAESPLQLNRHVYTEGTALPSGLERREPDGRHGQGVRPVHEQVSLRRLRERRTSVARRTPPACSYRSASIPDVCSTSSSRQAIAIKRWRWPNA